MSISRRSGAYADKHADQRPLSDKAYMQQSIRKLILYLAQHNYDQPISPKVLTRPANKDYYNVLGFLLRKIDPTISISSSSSEKAKKDFSKRVPHIFKGLRYPFTVSKAALTFVGVPHTWPSLLGTLSWLVELLSYDEVIAVEQARADNFEVQPEKLFFAYLGRTYKAFLEGHDEESKSIEEEIRAEFVERNAQISDEIATGRERCEGLETEMERLEGTDAEILRLRRRAEDLRKELEEQTALVARDATHAQTLRDDRAELKARAAALGEQIGKARRDRTRLQHSLQEQDLSPTDVQRLMAKRTQLKYELSDLRTNIDSEQKMIWGLEISQTKRIEEFTKSISAYNEQIHELELAPAAARYARGTTFQVDLNIHAASTEKLVSLDLEETVRPALHKVIQRLLEKSHEGRSETLLLQEESDVLSETIADGTQEVTELRQRIKRCENSGMQEQGEAGTERDDATTATNAAALQVQRLEVQCNHKRHQIRLAALELEQLRQTQNVNRAKYRDEEDAFTNSVVPLLSELADHKEQTQEALRRVVDHCAARLQEFRE